MSTEEFVDWTPDALSGRGADYIGLGFAFLGGLPAELEEPDPIKRLVGLMRLGDEYVLNERGDWESVENEQTWYGLAVQAVVDPLIQLELGCLLLKRADTEEPLCEHMYDSLDWEPEIVIHDEVGSGPPCNSWVREHLLRLALRAYGNAWDFYRYGPAGTHNFIRSLFALDGMRIAYQALIDTTQARDACDAFDGWLRYLRYQIGDRGVEFDDIVRELEKRFAHTRGQLEPIMASRREARKRLERELEYFDKLPTLVAGYLIDGEYMQSLLKDPSYNPRGIVAIYCQAVEAMLQGRLGGMMDIYLNGAPKAEAERFKDEFLRERDRKTGRTVADWRCAGLSIGQFAKGLGRPSFKSVLSKMGADAKFCFQELPSALWKLLEDRNSASHAGQRIFAEEGVLQVREIALAVLENLESALPKPTWKRTNDG